MAIMTIRAKNQVTVPKKFLERANLREGDPIEFDSLPDGGIGLYPLGRTTRRKSLWDLAEELVKDLPGIEDIELELPPRGHNSGLREVEW